MRFWDHFNQFQLAIEHADRWAKRLGVRFIVKKNKSNGLWETFETDIPLSKDLRSNNAFRNAVHS